MIDWHYPSYFLRFSKLVLAFYVEGMEFLGFVCCVRLIKSLRRFERAWIFTVTRVYDRSPNVCVFSRWLGIKVINAYSFSISEAEFGDMYRS